MSNSGDEANSLAAERLFCLQLPRLRLHYRAAFWYSLCRSGRHQPRQNIVSNSPYGRHWRAPWEPSSLLRSKQSFTRYTRMMSCYTDWMTGYRQSRALSMHMRRMRPFRRMYQIGWPSTRWSESADCGGCFERIRIRGGTRAGEVVQAHTRSYDGAVTGDRPVALESDNCLVCNLRQTSISRLADQRLSCRQL